MDRDEEGGKERGRTRDWLFEIQTKDFFLTVMFRQTQRGGGKERGRREEGREKKRERKRVMHVPLQQVSVQEVTAQVVSLGCGENERTGDAQTKAHQNL